MRAGRSGGGGRRQARIPFIIWCIFLNINFSFLKICLKYFYVFGQTLARKAPLVTQSYALRFCIWTRRRRLEVTRQNRSRAADGERNIKLYGFFAANLCSANTGPLYWRVLQWKKKTFASSRRSLTRILGPESLTRKLSPQTKTSARSSSSNGCPKSLRLKQRLNSN